MAQNFDLKENYGYNDLIEIMKILREECPWDKQQTHESISKNFIEETYEAVDAIRTGNINLLREELGDVLLQVIFHAEIENQSGNFSMDEVTDELCKKLIVRHPHIFGGIKADSSEQVLSNWESIKIKTKNQNTHTETLEDVPKSLPALMKAQKLQKRAKKCGFDFNNLQEAIDKLYEEIIELNSALEKGGESVEEEIGDILFSSVNISRMLSIDAETALNNSCDKFLKRFALMERQALDEGKNLEDMSLEQMDLIWEKIKAEIKNN